MYDIRYKIWKNRMYLKLEGFIKKDEAIQFRNECEVFHKKLKPNATFLFDARELKTLPAESMEEIQKVREHAVEYGTVKGVMVLKDNILKMQSQRTAKQIKGFNEEYFIDMNQAEE